jgi:biopolymer transport protein ExbD
MAVSLRGRHGGTTNPNIPTASTGDIAFLILIFFMSTSMFAKEKGLKIVLPERGDSPIKIKPENILNVAVNPQGQVQVNITNQPADIVNIPELRDLVVKRLAANKDLAISFRVSRRAPYRVMVEVFDQLKLAKAERISLLHVPELDEGTAP